MGKKLQPGVDKIPESWVKGRVKEILSNFTLKYDMPPASMYGSAGRHDFIICQRGRFWTIETKAGYNTPSDLQIGYADDIIGSGGYCYVINEFNFSRVQEIASRFNHESLNLIPSDNFRAYQGGAKYARLTWGAVC